MPEFMIVSVAICCYKVELTFLTAVRVEWSKAKACMERWTEEVMLLEEEMHWVIRFLRHSEGE